MKNRLVALATLAAVVAITLTSALAPASAAERKAASATIDATQKGEQISPLIYGQFIEHLGRCIYGGIWAEMLQDRKFHDAPNSWFWSLIGDAEFRNEKEGRFVGEASPCWPKGSPDEFGVIQFGLEFLREREYVGYVWLKKTDAQTALCRIDLGNGDAVVERELAKPVETAEDGYARYEFSFKTPALSLEKETGSFAVIFKGEGEARLGTASLMPADNIDGMRADTLKLLKELNAPIYRWPGGNFVSGYNWKDGIGPRDRRPPRKNPAWQGIEHNDFGIDEFMLFCKHLNTLPDVAVNTGSGQVDSALEELEYANGAADSKWGAVRAKNGHEAPYAVKHWCIGNEMFGDWQIGHMPTEKYAVKNNEFVDAFRKVDPNLTLICVGAVGAWDDVILRKCADHIDWLSEHFYVQENPDVVAHVELARNSIRGIADAHRRYREEIPELKGKDIRIAMDEWNHWYGPHLFGELGTRYFLKDGLGIAEGLHEYFRNSDIFVMANYAQTVNVIGCIKTSKTNAQFETTGLVLKLYRNEFGVNPLKVEQEAPFDVAAATTEDGKTLTVAVVNPTQRELKFSFNIKGLNVADGGKRFEIAGNDPQLYNDPDYDQKIDIVEAPFAGSLEKGVEIAPLSVTLFSVPLK